MTPYKIVILGCGWFGTSLAQHLAKLGRDVWMWTRCPEEAKTINQTHYHPNCLQNIQLHHNIHASSEMSSELFQNTTAILTAIPTQALREVLLQAKPHLPHQPLIINVAKGIEIGSHQLPSQIIAETIGVKQTQRYVSLSGPSFAQEVADGLPTAVSAGSHHYEAQHLVQDIFHSPYFRVYTSPDPIGLEIAGAIKNIIAIAAGACQGLGFAANSQAALITRGLAEMTRIGTSIGANPMTFRSLGGVGDLFLTCSSQKSRNFQVGWLLGQGKTRQEAMDAIGSTAEGVTTTLAARELGKRQHISTPITDSVYKVLHEDQPIRQAVQELMARDAKHEWD
ncbi:MAG: NAD(P)H-dependent glycerol-3-phosphate dehydrogenase [Oligoflexales bacterium]